jgi:hypothetical protein
MNVAETIVVKKRDPHKACFDMENRFGVYGDHEQEVLRTPFIISKVKSGELIEIEKNKQEKGNEPKDPNELSVDDFRELKAEEQREVLKTLEIDAESNGDKRTAQFEEWLVNQDENRQKQGQNGSNYVALEELVSLEADKQRDILISLGIEPSTDEGEYAAQYEEWLKKQEEGAE